LSRGDRSRPGRERSAEERERDRQERARQRALRAGEPPPDEPAAPSLEELPDEGERLVDSAGVEQAGSAGADALREEGEPFAYPPAAQETAPADADALPSEDATVDAAPDSLAQTPPAFHEPIDPAPKERPYSEDPVYAPPATPEHFQGPSHASTPEAQDEPWPAIDPAAQEPPAVHGEPAGAEEQRPVSSPPLPLPPAPSAPSAPASRAPAPERPVPPPASSRRSRSLLARLAAVFALAAVAVALLLLFHSLRSKPAVKAAVPTVVKLVIPEGKTRAQIAQIASAAGLTGSYRAASRHSPLLNPAHYGAPHGTPDLEGFLFPATYDMDRGAAVGRLVQEQLIAFRENFGAQELARARSLHVTPYDLLIVASMVEREAQVPGDRSKIAAVIYNRLREGMPLGIDATIYYAVELAKGIPTYTHELSEAQLHIDSPYNTRLHAGLPPTPISNPGVASIDAAAHPAHVSYLYYVAGADGCGEQVFSNTLAEFEVHSVAYKAAVEKNGGHPPSCKHALTGTPSGAQAGR
jgi:UPF0755 protein